MESRGAARSAALGLANIPRGAPVEFARIDFGRVRQEAADGADEDATAPIDAAEGGAARNAPDAPDEAEAGGLDEAGEADGQPEVVEVVEVEDEVEEEA